MPIFLIVAYHDTMDVSPSFQQHTKRGYQEKILIPEPQPERKSASQSFFGFKDGFRSKFEQLPAKIIY